MNKTRSFSLIAAALVATLAGCKQEAPAPQETGTSHAAAAGAEISARDGKLVLPAIPGRPGAVYFTIRNDGSKPVALTRVEVAGAASAQMHETSGGSMKSVESMAIAPGAELEFSPGGLHVMVFDISAGLKPGQTTDLTLSFAGGETLTMPVMIDTMGSRDDMDGMGPMAAPSSAPDQDNGRHNHGDAMNTMPGMNH